MKKIVMVLVMIAFFTCIGGNAFADGKTTGDFNNSVGVDIMTYAFSIQKTDSGAMEVVRGVNAGIGYTAKHFFKPAQIDEFNPFWAWGTVALIAPFVGIGADYITSSGFYFTIGTLYIAPYIGFGLYF